MNTFDKICSAIAGLLGVVLLAFGALGTFVGVNLSLALPPVIAVVIAFAGWGILKPIYLAWNLSPSEGRARSQKPAPAFDEPEPDLTNWGNQQQPG